jgi:hypothetical protein
MLLRRRASTVALGVVSMTACGVSAPPPVAPLPVPSAAPAPEPPAEAQPEPSASPPPEPAAEAVKDAPPAARLTSKGYVTWIFGRPKADKRYIGYLRYGTSVALKSTELVPGEKCRRGFYQIEPRGYVCNDHTVTLSPSPRFREGVEATTPFKGPFPYRYAISNGAPMYNRVPTAAEQRRKEGKFGPAGKFLRLPKTLAAHEELATLDRIAPADPLPSFLARGGLAAEDRVGLVKETIPLGAMLSFTRAFEAEGRTWLLSADQTLVPADRVRPFRPSEFHGVRLDGDVRLPLAWMRARARPKLRRLASGAFEKTGAAWPVRTFAALTGAVAVHEEKRYHETRERDADGSPLYIAERDATVAEALGKLPAYVAPNQKWIVVSITQGTLVAYEGMTPVYATLMSPGAGGVPVKGQDNVKASTTPTGTFNVTFKDRAATMSPEKGENRSFWIADVPYTQYFNPPFALHAAYWHERFGEPTSAGCINVSPLDAQALFEWSDPVVPPEWQGATGAGARENGGTTAIVVRR